MKACNPICGFGLWENAPKWATPDSSLSYSISLFAPLTPVPDHWTKVPLPFCTQAVA